MKLHNFFQTFVFKISILSFIRLGSFKKICFISSIYVKRFIGLISESKYKTNEPPLPQKKKKKVFLKLKQNIYSIIDLPINFMRGSDKKMKL